MPYPYTTVNEEDRILGQLGIQRTATAKARKNATPQQAADVSGLKRSFPWLSPGTTVALAQQGFGASHPVAKAAADTEILANGKNNSLLPGQEATTTGPGHKKLRNQLKDLRNSLGNYDDESIAGDPFLGMLGVTDVNSARTMKRQLQSLMGQLDTNPNAVAAARKIQGAVDQFNQNQGDSGDFSHFVSAATGGVGHVAGWISQVLQAGNELPQQAADTAGVALPQIPGGPEAVKAVARTAGVAAESGLQAVQGATRIAMGQGGPLNPASYVPSASTYEHVAEQTSAGQAVKALVEDRPVDLGSGYLPDQQSGVEKAQAAAARKYSPYLIDGHAWTPGRALGAEIVEPGTEPFNIISGLVDGATAIAADPANIGLSELSSARAAGRRFATADEIAQAGAHVGTRHWWQPKIAEDWLTQGKGDTIVKKMVGMDAWSIWNSTGRKLPLETADGRFLLDDLAKAGASENPEQAIREVLLPHLGTDIRDVPNWSGYTVRPKVFDTVPGRVFDPNDRGGAALTVDRYLNNAAVPVSERRTIFNQVAAADSDPYAVLDATMNAVGRSLERAGLDEFASRDMTTAFKNSFRDANAYYTDALGNDAWFPGVAIDGTGHPQPTPHLDVEKLTGPVALPDFREIRAAVSGLAPIVNNGMFKTGVAVLDSGMVPWRKLMLMRPAWSVRVIGEEQVRMAAAGATSLVNHPLSAMAWIIGNGSDSKIAQLLERTAERLPGEGTALKSAAAKLRTTESEVGRGMFDLVGHPFTGDDIYEDGLHSAFTAISDTDKHYLRQFDRVDRTHPEYARGLAEETARLNNSKMAQAAARAESPEDLHAWWWDGEGKATRLKLGQTESQAALLSDPQYAAGYIDSVTQRLREFTGGNEKLLDAIKTGKLNERGITDGWRPTNRAIGDFGDLAKAGVGPEKVKVERVLTLDTPARKLRLSHLNKTLDAMFNGLMPRPSNYLSRSPEFRQNYWQRAEELFPSLDEAGRSKVLANLADANLGKATERRFQLLERTPVPATPLTAEHADLISKRFALDETKNLLYDLSERSQFFDVFRLIFPFGEAWKEVVTRWAKIAYENPQVLRRGQQLIQGGRGAGAGDVLNPSYLNGSGDGFFRKDPQTGEEVFTYPGSGWLTDKLIGVPIGLKGALGGANMVGQGLPGLGPAASIPVSWFLPDQPQFDDVRNLLFPYGDRNAGNPFSDIPNAFIPSWLDKFKTALSDPDSTRLYANTVKDVADYLQSTGEYDLHGDDAQSEMRRLLGDAKDKAKWFYIIRGIAQSSLPTSPQPEFLVQDKKGRGTLAFLASQEYQNRVKKDGPDAALKWLIDAYGEENFLLAQPKSRALVPNVPTTSQGLSWERAHDELTGKYPNVWTFFAPNGGAFDQTAYEEQFARGQRDQLSPEKMLRLGNARLAAARYAEAQRKVDEAGTPTGSAQYLRDTKAWLIDHYPGYQEQTSGTAPTQVLVQELQRAVTDPKLARTDAGKGLKLYLKARDEAIAHAKAAGLSGPFTAKSQVETRHFLRDTADWIIQQHPGFRAMYDWVFDHEMKQDQEQPA